MPTIAVERTKQIFRYLKAFAERNQPIRRSLAEQLWQLPLRDLPAHVSIKIGQVVLTDSGTNADVEEAPSQDPLIRVRRPSLAAAPNPPSEISEWIQAGWESPDGAIQTIDSRTQERNGSTTVSHFSDDPKRSEALARWQADWTVWANTELPARHAMRVFERMYELHGWIEREAEAVELILGDGRLRWLTGAGLIDHPILLQRVELIFDATVPEFRVVDADRAPDLYGALLPSGEGLASRRLTELREELESGGYHPLAGPETDAYLARIAPLLGVRGTFVREFEDQAPGDSPALFRDPVLLLRTRESGFPAAFDRVLQDLERGVEPPISINRLVGVESEAPTETDAPTGSPWGEPGDVLLSKPANIEQVQIARALERHRAVIVQGPPGTGKSHTIANLIGHLVAHGKRVLVTSHATKALRVLRDQIVETLQPLAVSVLDRDLDSRNQMEAAVRGILARLTLSTDAVLVSEASTIRDRRDSINAEIERITEQLRAIRAAEYQPILVAGDQFDPAEAARWVKGHKEGNDWIPGPLEAGAPLPLSTEEVRRLYELNGLLTAEEESAIEGRLPEPDALVSIEEFGKLARTPNANESATARFWLRAASKDDVSMPREFRDFLRTCTRDLDEFADWQNNLVRAGYAGEAEWQLWDELATQVRDAHAKWRGRRQILVRQECQARGAFDVHECLELVREILSQTDGEGAIGRLKFLLHPSWKTLTKIFLVDGKTARTASAIRVIEAFLEIIEDRDQLSRRWSRQAVPLGLPAFDSMGSEPESAALAFVEQFRSLGDWWQDRWQSISSHAASTGLNVEKLKQQQFASSDQVLPFERDVEFIRHSLTSVVDIRFAVARYQLAQQRIRELEQGLAGFEGRVVAEILASVKKRDPAGYEIACKELQRLIGKRALWQERRDLSSRLAVAAPKWANAIKQRKGKQGGSQVPGDPSMAWRWQQLSEEIARRASRDEIALARRLEQHRKELRDTTASLIDRMAWLAQLQRTDLASRQALQGWADTVRKIGKGTGKRTVELQSRARELLAQARNAVPVWIMPLARVAESFDPAAGRFDVVIVDEASQSDIQGLLAWYLGDHVAIVGDHEQVSPLAVGQNLDQIRALMEQHLREVPNSHLYDGTTSVYDLARQCFGGTIALREHFRCVPDIIEFSNALSYNFEIQPLRNPNSAPRPHVVELVVDGSIGTGRDGKTNVAEARVSVAVIAAALEMPQYEGKSFGVITLLGDEQAALVQHLAVEVVGAVELNRRRFASGNSAQFQGDERDVMLLTMVDTPTGGPLRILQTPAMKQRYNVAASRAKDQLWLIHSLDPNRDLQAGDLRRRLIDHVRDPSARRTDLERAAARAESPFELAVLERLVAAGIRVQPQVWVGRYRLDFVAYGAASEVAVECDGDRFHGLEKIQEDMFRQAVLERAGWRFVRIRGTRFFRDPDATMKWVLGELIRLGVEPGARDSEVSQSQPADDLRAKIIRRAWEIMRERKWIGEDVGVQSNQPQGISTPPPNARPS